MTGDSLPGKVFDSPDEDFWRYGVGAMVWLRVHGHRALYVLLPGAPDARRGLDVDGVLLYVDHEDDNWAAEGTIHGWDGNVWRPTLSPSIETPYWHGYIEAGRLRTA